MGVSGEMLMMPIRLPFTSLIDRRMVVSLPLSNNASSICWATRTDSSEKCSSNEALLVSNEMFTIIIYRLQLFKIFLDFAPILIRRGKVPFVARTHIMQSC